MISESVKLQPTLPVGPLRDTVIFPGNPVPIISGRMKSKAAVDAACASDKLIVFVTQKNHLVEDPNEKDLYKVGTACLIRRIVKNPDGEYTLTAEGITRVYLKNFVQTEPYLEAEIEEIPELYEKSEQTEALSRTVREQVKRLMELLGNPMFETGFSGMPLYNFGDDPNQLVNSVTQIVDFKTIDKQQILEMVSSLERLQRLSELLAREIRVLEISQRISSQTQERVSKMTKEAILREQMKSIEEELGENGENQEIHEFELKIKKTGMPQEVRVKAQKELQRLAKMSTYNPEAGYIRNYLEWLTDLPWKKGSSGKRLDLKKSEKILDEDHYGLKKVKERIVEYLAVQKLAGKMKGPILCFVGPPGVGKTSIGKSIAHSLGREFVKVSLGGIRDEAEIRGHRRTYVGALPGRIIQGIKDAGTKNPVFMLDEIDKVGTDFRGDPSSALLEALDPEQNSAFSDHYLEVPFDLSNVLFITTANVLYTIPPALRDRLEVINFAGYTHDEKFRIAKDFLIEKQTETHGLSNKEIEITDGGLRFIIEHYTREAGVRNLERQIASLLRKVAKMVAEGKKKKVAVTSKNVPKYLGPIKMHSTLIEKKDEVGMSTGLAWTEAGGDILFIEVALMPGKGSLLLTGQLGDVMKESCQAAMSYIRARGIELGLSPKFFQKIDVHVHVPEGAVPKDGPSAGDDITTAIVSALTKIPVKRTVGMTGEVTLRGRVLEIGGVKEKVIAAHRAGLKTIILPKDNKKDLVDIPKEVIRDLDFKFVTHMDEVLDIALVKQIARGKIESQQRPMLHAQAPYQAD